MITKAVLFAAGAGTRMQQDADVALTAAQREAAAAGHKALMPVGRPFIDYVLWSLEQAGVREVCVVVHPARPAVMEYLSTRRTGALRVCFAVQREARGTADALASAAAFIGQDHVLTVNGDNLYPVAAIRTLVGRAMPALVGFSGAGLLAQGTITPERLRGFALIVADAAGHLVDILEKPSAAQVAAAGAEALYSMNLWALPPQVVAACARIAPSARGELELPDAIRATIHEDGVSYAVHRSDEGVLDLSRRADIATVTARLAAVQVPW
jgi:glucose-1-phosphate thymidylyltransferase